MTSGFNKYAHISLLLLNLSILLRLIQVAIDFCYDVRKKIANVERNKSL